MRYFEDFKAGDVVELGSTSLTEDEIIRFAKAYDPQPFHIDPAAAAKTDYRGIIASGWHTAVIFMRLLADGALKDAATLGSPGLDELRWSRPVRPGDRLNGRVTVLEARPSASRPDRGIVKTKGELFNQKNELVMTVVAATFFFRRPTA